MEQKSIADKIFGLLSPDFDKLRGYGFKPSGKAYAACFPVMQSRFSLEVKISPSGEAKTRLTDLDTNEEYTLHLVESAKGAFVGSVRAEYERTLAGIAEKCFYRDVFKNEYAHAVMGYVTEKYGDEIEYLWEKSPENAVFRRKDNRKWYGVIMKIKAEKLGLEGGGDVVVLDVRATQESICTLINGIGYFPAYHMNKNSWITILLDGSVPMQEIYARIDESFLLAYKKPLQKRRQVVE